MHDPSLRSALSAVARAFPDYFCKAYRSSPGMIHIVLHLCTDGSLLLGWTTTDVVLTNPSARERTITQMRAALRQPPEWPRP